MRPTPTLTRPRWGRELAVLDGHRYHELRWVQWGARRRRALPGVITPTMVANAHLMLVRDALYLAGIGSNACGRQGQQRDTHLARSTAGAAAWLPHSKRRDTRMTSG
ncbi:MAG: hypothetical protein KatS3mg054_0861 [Chloroflexus sp.]|nr:MAG: hypothetical protein KatS3mg054_0861 [Chloroflexus sp.]GIV92097.1 MAG: hypothetical protein KatS3mg056_0806 [Chloroflexus sp.]